jgi:hypothetical protein
MFNATNNRIADSGWSYDAAGNITAGWMGLTLAYDAENRQVAACYLESLEELDGEGYQVLAYVRILHFPDERWTEIVAKSLGFFTDRGAAIAWAGGYECFVRYSDRCKFLGCYAALTPKGGVACLGGLDEPLRYISDDPDLVDKLHGLVASTDASGRPEAGRGKADG